MKTLSRPTPEPHNFGGLEIQNYKKARVVVLPVPFEATTSYIMGTRKGPRAIIEASRHMELFDIESKKTSVMLGFSLCRH
jgi:agmatinase